MCDLWCHNYCKGGFWILVPKGKRTKAQRAQYKELVESGLKTKFQWVRQRSKWIKDWSRTRKNRFYTKKFFLGKVQGESFLNIFLLNLIIVTVLSPIVFFLSTDSQMPLYNGVFLPYIPFFWFISALHV